MRTFEICLEIYELDPAHFLYASELVWQTALNTMKVKLNLLTDIDALLMVEKGIRGKICYTSYRYVNANNKYMKNYDKNKEPPYLKCWDEIICIDGQRHKNYPKLIFSGLEKHLNLINIS